MQMKILKIVVTLFAASFFITPAYANKTCETVIAELAKPQAAKLSKVDTIIKTLLSGVHLRMPRGLKFKNDYSYLLVRTNKKSGLLVLEPGNDYFEPGYNFMRQDIVGNSNVAYAIDPVLPGEKSIWQSLTYEERKELVIKIAQTFASATYDHAIAVSSLGVDHINEALTKNNPEDKWEFAFGARKLFKAASQGKCIGICRHTAAAMPALLMQLGAHPLEVQITSTFNHVYVAVKFRPDEDWTYIDPTPGLADIAGSSFDTNLLFKDNPGEETYPMLPYANSRQAAFNTFAGPTDPVETPAKPKPLSPFWSDFEGVKAEFAKNPVKILSRATRDPEAMLAVFKTLTPDQIEQLRSAHPKGFEFFWLQYGKRLQQSK
jgi:hypothetical protein